MTSLLPSTSTRMRAAISFAVLVLIATSCGASQTTQVAPPEEPTVVEVTADPTEPPAEPTATPLPTEVPEQAATPEPEPEPTVAPTLTGPLAPSGGDDTELLQDALNAVPENGEVLLGPGEFEVSDTLIIRLDVDLVGAGQFDTVIHRSTDGTILDANRVDLGLKDLTFRSSYVTDAEERSPMLDITSSTIDMESAAVEFAPGTGAWMFDVTGTIDDTLFLANGWIGLWVVGESDLSITNSLAEANEEGFLFDDTSNGSISGSTANGNSGAGFWWDNNADGIVSESIATANGFGFLATGQSTPLFVGNLAEDNTEVGFGFRDQSAGFAIDNDANNNVQGFYVDNEAAPTLTDNRAVKNTETGFAWFDTAAGVLEGAEANGNGTDIFIDENANPQVLEEGETAADPTPTPSATTDSGCPTGFALSGAQCVRVVGSPELVCAEGVLTGGVCAVDVAAFADQTCGAPYLLYRAEAGDPTLPGLNGTCAWFDSGGVCPAGDTYNPQAPNGELFSHPCKHAPEVGYSCEQGSLVGDVCRLTGSPSSRCTAGVLSGGECLEYADPTG